ncbi:MAG: hypothetical protein EHM24_11725 [Acidobacteria bacterium]|nr:MAG: hypothetical protein EHM24_11725 [Acidobacteriota bacterium]
MKRTLLSGLACGVAWVAAAGASAVIVQDGPARLVNAKVETKSVASGLDQAFRALVSARQTAGWIAYSVPAVPGERHMCDGGWETRYGTTYLEGRNRAADAGSGGKVSLEGPRDIYVFLRAEAGRVHKIHVLSPDCEIDAGGLPVQWLTQVNPAESVALLSTFVVPSARRKADSLANGALMAVALHQGPAAARALDGFVAPGQALDIRKQAAFWLAAGRGRDGFETLRRLTADSDPAFRKELAFPISVSKEAAAVDTLIRLAREDESPEVRRQALFWVGQKAGARAAEAITGAIEHDPDTEVKKRAVFALSQMPKEEGVPRLIEVARTNRNAEVRKQAVFWLGQSNDPRALKFFEEILKK